VGTNIASFQDLTMMQQIAASPHLGYRVVGFIHDMDGPPVDFGRFTVLGTMDELDSVLRSNHVGEVIIALPSHQHTQIWRTVRVCERAGADFKLSPILASLEPYKKYVSSFGNLQNAATIGSVHTFTPATWLSATRPDTGGPKAHMATTLDQVIAKVFEEGRVRHEAVAIVK